VPHLAPVAFGKVRLFCHERRRLRARSRVFGKPGDFDPKKPPPKTEAFWTVANAHRTPEDAELADVLEGLGHPNGVTIGRLQSAASGDFAFWLGDRKNRRNIPHRLESCGYVPVRNPDAKDGLWKIGGAVGFLSLSRYPATE
jgi:hypothetical protein